jgi:Dolichyl-phosphate-mannose-protein mannosyltransferase
MNLSSPCSGAEFMETLVDEGSWQPRQADSPQAKPTRGTLPRALSRVRRSLSNLLIQPESHAHARPHRGTLVLSCVAVFVIAVGVRALFFQDNYAQLARHDPWMTDLARHYKNEARRYLEERRILYPRDPVDPGDARLILHPPGYSAMIAGIFAVLGDSDSKIRLVQILADGLSAVLLLLIASQLLPFTVSLLSAALVALSPHLAFHSLWISPDTVCVLPILAAVYLVIEATKRPRIALMIGAGALIGVSCWLRANGLLLAVFLAVAVMLLIEKGRRLRYASALVIATVVIISPIAIRNWILFHHFIPISIAGGENLVVGIADFDVEGRFGMPASDSEAGFKDAEWLGHPEYRESPWSPDGIERDQARFKKGFDVIRSNPEWFLGIVIRRACFMLKYNESAPKRWPFNTSTVPIVSVEPPVMHTQASAGNDNRLWSLPAAALLGDEPILSKQSEVSIEPDGQSLVVRSDGSEFGEQMASSPIALMPERDYLLTAAIDAQPGPMVAQVTSLDGRIALASEVVNAGSSNPNPKKQKRNSSPATLGSEISPQLVELTFASGHRTKARFTIANNGNESAGSVTRIGDLQLFDLGPTPYLWTRYPRMVLRGLERNLFKTGSMLPLVISGTLLLALAGRRRELATLMIVPAYYICAQSVLSTEYRYILAIHYFLFVMAGVTFYCAATGIREISRQSRVILFRAFQALPRRSLSKREST